MMIRKAVVEDAFGIAKVQVDSWHTTYKGIVSDDYLQQLSYEKRNPFGKRRLQKKLYMLLKKMVT
ncbi:hypothetical protein [Fervidibacillus albus]|uniref:hypothetical protein n=1 Tax=Fervidibacillus albus TaxID=2980026 RepID=UPI0030844E37